MTTPFTLRQARTLRELQDMLGRVRPEHLDLPLHFVLMNRGQTCVLQHVGRADLFDDVVGGDKGAFVLPDGDAASDSILILSFDAAAEIDRSNILPPGRASAESEALFDLIRSSRK